MPRNRSHLRRSALALVVFACVPLSGQERTAVTGGISSPSSRSLPALVQELFISEVPTVQERHEIQVSIGSAFYRQSGARLARSLFKTEYGLTGRLQVESEFSYEHVSGPDPDFHAGPQDLAVGLRYALGRHRRILLTAGLGLNALNPESTTVQLEPSLVAATALGRAQLQLGAAISVSGLREQEYSYAVILPLRRWRPTLEFKEQRAGGQLETLIAPGMIRSVHGFEIGVACPVHLTGPGPRVAPMFLVTREFGGESE